MSEQLFTLPQVVVFDTNAALVSGAKANFYIAGTLTRQNTYTDSALATPHANPVVADGNGLLDPIYLDATLNYKVDVTDSLDSSLEGYPVDNLTASLTATEVGTALWPVTSVETSVGVTPTNVEYEPGDVRRYGVTGDGVTDDTAAFANAILVGDQGVRLYGSGTYNLTSKISTNANNLEWDFYQATFSINHAGIGIEFGTTVGDQQHIDVQLGAITTTNTAYTSESVGLQVQNAAFFTVKFRNIIGPFEKGLHVLGSNAKGLAYGTFYGQRIVSCKFQVYVSTITASSWANDVKYWIDRMGNRGSDPSTVGGYHVYLDGAGGGDIPQSHRFFGCNFESAVVTAGIPETAFYDDGSRNEIIGCYFEGSGPTVWNLHPVFIKQGPNYTRGSIYHQSQSFLGLANVSLLAAASRTTILGEEMWFFGGGDGTNPQLILQERNSATNKTISIRQPDGTEMMYMTADGKLSTAGNVGFNGQAPAAAPDYTTGAHATLRDFTGTTTAADALKLLETLVDDLITQGLLQ